MDKKREKPKKTGVGRGRPKGSNKILVERVKVPVEFIQQFWAEVEKFKTARGVSFEDMAKETGAKSVALRMSFSKKTNAKLQRAFEFSDGLNVDITYLLGRNVADFDNLTKSPINAEEAIQNFWSNIDRLGGLETPEENRKLALAKLGEVAIYKPFIYGTLPINIGWLGKIGIAFGVPPYQLICGYDEKK